MGRFSGKKRVEPGISRVSLEDFHQNLIEIEQICRKNNIPAIFLTNPVASLEAYWGPGKVSKVHLINQAYNDAIRQLAHTHNFKVIDTALLFENRKDLHDHPQADYIHYNALGHKLVARTLYDYLTSNKFLFPQN